MFVPGEPDGNKVGNEPSVVLEPERYALALVFYQERYARQSGAKYIRGKFRVLAGPAKGKETWMTMSLDVSKPRVANFLNMLCKAMNLTPEDSFDPEDGTQVKRALCFRPFQVVLRKKKRRGGPDAGFENDFGEFFWPEEWSPQFATAAEKWRIELQEEDEAREKPWDGTTPQQRTGGGGNYWSGNSAGGAGQDDFWGGGPAGGGEDPGWPGDDDIPF